MNLILITMSDAKLHHLAISAKANLRKQVKPQRGGRSQNLFEIWMALGHIFSSGITCALRTLACTEDMDSAEACYV